IGANTIDTTEWANLDGLNQTVATTSSPTFAGVTLSGLTATRLVATNAANLLVSSDIVNWIIGTANQVIVTDNLDGTVTLSLPQDIDTSADVEFDSLILDDLTASRLVATNAANLLVSSDIVNWIDGTANKITVTDDLDGTVTLTIPDAVTLAHGPA
ncbi:MAG: hypothetical protein PHU95_00755, partial [Candidatus Thermoplasmatota archaeon]|nr:hypothetical protein [Candidatus Thermoplasmatota archaeon]